jgi:glycosyltransferase involved in cell wall biosynthesis
MADARKAVRRLHFISTNPARWGGSEELWHAIALRALEEGHEVLASVFKHPVPHEKVLQLQRMGARIDYRSLPCYHFDQPLPRLVMAQLRDRLDWNRHRHAWGLAARFKADALMISAGETLDGYLYEDSFPIRDARGRGIPYFFVGHFHHEHSKVLPQRARQRKAGFLEGSAAQLYVSLRNLQMTRSELQHHLPGARIIHNPFSVAESTREASVSGDRIRMAFVARLECEVKCQDILVQVLAHPSLRDLDLTLDIYGEGSDREYLESLISFHGLTDRVTLRGHHPDPAEIWVDHDILVLTSRGEGTPLTLFEAMRAGRTAIVTNVGDSALWMGGGRGYVSPAPTSEAIRETLLRAISERNTWEEKGRACRRLFHEKWNREHSEQIYQALLGEYPAAEIGWDSETYARHLGWDA